MPEYRYLHLDVFTDRIFGGNPLAVFSDAEGVDEATMQAIAREINYSETTFVLPPADGASAVRVRIFTPAREMPMAGHPTIGTAFALAHLGAIRPGLPEVVFGLGVGPTPVRLTWEHEALAFAEMRQRLPVFGEPVEVTAPAAAAVSVSPEELCQGLPVQVVSCGVPFLLVPLASRDAVDRATAEPLALGRVCSRLGLDACAFVFSLEPGPDEATAYSRMFAPGLGVSEDPACGAGSGALGCYLLRHGLVDARDAQHIVSLQGVKMRRPSRIHIAIDTDGGRITAVRVGGQAVLAGEGRVHWQGRPAITAAGTMEGRAPGSAPGTRVVRILQASEDDAAAILAIYNHYVEHSFASYFKTKVGAEFIAAQLDIRGRYPVVVAKDAEGRVLGFGVLRRYNRGNTFDRTAEVGYFLHPHHTHRGIGSYLLAHLAEHARRMRIRVLLASISSRNEESLAFHRKHGFGEVARLPGIGEKFGGTFDVVYMQKWLESGPETMLPLPCREQ